MRHISLQTAILLLPILSVCTTGDSLGQVCDLDTAPAANVDALVVTVTGGRPSFTRTVWMTAAGDVLVRRYEYGAPIERLATQLDSGEFDELLKLAVDSRNATREWLEADRQDSTPDTLQELLDIVRKGVDGQCYAHFDGIDTSVTLTISGREEEHECVGFKWEEFKRRFGQVINTAMEVSGVHACPSGQ